MLGSQRSTGTATRNINIWAVLVAASWRHVGYIMLLYLAGLKGVDPALREAAAVDGANEAQTFFRVVFPVHAPDQHHRAGRSRSSSRCARSTSST